MCGYSGTGDKADLDNHANQLNPNNEEYAGSEADEEEDQPPFFT